MSLLDRNGWLRRSPFRKSTARRRAVRTPRVEDLESRELLAFLPVTDSSGLAIHGARDLTVAGGKLFFVANSSGGGEELWVSDGSLAHMLLETSGGLRPGPDGSNPQNLTNLDGTLFFTADTGQAGRELYATDGKNVNRITDLAPGPASARFGEIVHIGNSVYFTGEDPAHLDQGGLFKFDGGPLVNLVPSYFSGTGYYWPDELTPVENRLFFRRPGAPSPEQGTSFDFALYKTDGTPASTQLLRGSDSSRGAQVGDLTAIGNKVFFRSFSVSHGHELWQSSGYLGETVEAVDVIAGPESSSPSNLINVDGVLYFTASVDDPLAITPQTALFRIQSNGEGLERTTTLTTPSQIIPASASDFVAAGQRLHFTAYHPTYGREVVSVGLGPGSKNALYINTNTLPSMFGGDQGSGPKDLTNVGDTPYFTADDGRNGRQVWKATGEITATRITSADFSGGYSNPANLVSLNNTLYLTLSGPYEYGNLFYVPNANVVPRTQYDRLFVSATDPLTIPVLANDVDPDGDPLTVSEASSPQEAPGSVILVPDADGKVRSVRFTPPANLAPGRHVFQFRYSADDGRGGRTIESVEVDIQVPTPPPPPPPPPPGPPPSRVNELTFLTQTSTFSRKQKSILIPVRLTTASTKRVTINYGFTGGTAKLSQSLQIPAQKTLTFRPGETLKLIKFGITKSKAARPQVTAILRLTKPVGARLGTLTVHRITLLATGQ